MTTSDPVRAAREPLRILCVAHYSAPEVGGAERYAEEISRRLMNDGFQVSRLATDLPCRISPARFRVLTSSYHPAWAREVDSILTRLDPHVLYVHHTIPGLTDVALRVAAARGLPVALMYHGDVTGAEWPKRLAGTIYHAFIGRGSLAVPTVVFVSSAAYARRSPILRNLSAPCIEAPPGVDSVMREGVGAGGRYLLFVGKPSVASKGFGVLLEAWRRLSERWPEHELRVVGGTNGSGELPPRTRWLGRIESRRALADLYAGADATILPSLTHAESFGMALAEALVAGSPIVGSDIGGIPSLVEEGVNGHLVPPGEVDTLCEALASVMRDREAFRNRVAQRRDAYARRFSWDATARTVADQISALTDRHRPVSVGGAV